MKTSPRCLLLFLFGLLFVQTATAHYDPRIGRFLSRDPIGETGGFNLYGYCGNDPVNRNDPLGLRYPWETIREGRARRKMARQEWNDSVKTMAKAYFYCWTGLL